MQFGCIESRYLAYCCYIIMLCQDKMAIKTCAQCYIVYICISICQYFISVLYQHVYFVIVWYIEEKHLTTIVKKMFYYTYFYDNTTTGVHISILILYIHVYTIIYIETLPRSDQVHLPSKHIIDPPCDTLRAVTQLTVD